MHVVDCCKADGEGRCLACLSVAAKSNIGSSVEMVGDADSHEGASIMEELTKDVTLSDLEEETEYEGSDLEDAEGGDLTAHTPGEVDDVHKVVHNDLMMARNAGRSAWRQVTTPADIVGIPHKPKTLGNARRNNVMVYYWIAVSYIDNNKNEKEVFSGQRLGDGHVAILVYVPKVENSDNVYYCLSATPGKSDFRCTPLLDLDHDSFDDAPAFAGYKQSKLEMLDFKSNDNKTAWLDFIRNHHIGQGPSTRPELHCDRLSEEPETTKNTRQPIGNYAHVWQDNAAGVPPNTKIDRSQGDQDCWRLAR